VKSPSSHDLLPSYVRLTTKVRGWIPRDGTAVARTRLRIIKSPEEIALIRQAIAATEASIAATFSQLAVGMSERDVSGSCRAKWPVAAHRAAAWCRSGRRAHWPHRRAIGGAAHA